MNAIVAVDEQWGIGYKGKLLFSVPEDLRHVRELTEGQTLVMGRKTFLSLPGGKPLPNRRHIVLTRDPAFEAGGITLCRSLGELAEALQDTPPQTVWNFGGAEIYRLLLPYCETAHITKFGGHKTADCFFPDLDAEPRWRLVQQTEPALSGEVYYQFCEYRQDRVDTL